MAPHFILEAMQVDYELILVDREHNAQKSADYLALNPTGRIPTLVDNGQPIFESAAICMHLAESHPQYNLIPNVGDSARPLFLQWMMYLTNTLQAELMVYFYPERHTTERSDAERIKRAQELRVTDMFKLLDQELEHKEYLLGHAISACDYYLFMLAVWADDFQQPPLSFANLARYLRQMAQRKEVYAVCKKENLRTIDRDYGVQDHHG